VWGDVRCGEPAGRDVLHGGDDHDVLAGDNAEVGA
jgi:hypothetical protein